MPQNDLSTIRNSLNKFIQDTKNNQVMKNRGEFVSSISQEVIRIFAPVLKEMLNNSRLNKQDIKDVAEEIATRISIPDFPEINVPEAHVTVDIPEIRVPTPQVNYTPPVIKIPDIVMPDEMNIRGWVQLQGVNFNNPLPVQLRDKDGNPVNLLENLTTVINQGGGGAARIVKIGGINDSAWGALITPDGRLKTEAAAGSTGLTDTELRASSVPVIQVTGSVNSVNILQIAGDTPAKGTELNVGYLRTFLAQDSAYSVRAIANSGVDIGDVDILSIAAGDNIIGDVDVKQVSGAIDSVSVTSITSPIAQGDEATALRVVVAGNSGVSVTATQTGAWTVSLSGSLNSAVAVGPTVADTADDGSAPVQFGGIARTANPTAMAANDVVKATFDDLGRQLIRPVQVRDLLQTAYVSLTTGTETTLLAGVAGVFFDLVYIMGSNNSDVAATVSLRSATGAGIVSTMRIPANGTAGVSLSVPLPQDTAADTWTADLEDITGTTITLGALFSREV